MSALTCNTCGWITGVSDESCLDEFDATASNSSVTCASGYDMCSVSIHVYRPNLNYLYLILYPGNNCY